MEASLNEMFLSSDIIDDALGSIGMRGNPVAKRSAKAVMRNLKHVITREQVILSSFMKHFPLDTQKKIQEGKIQLEAFALTVRAQLTATNGNRQLILGPDSDSKRVVGVKNIEGNELDQYENLVVTKVRVAHATHASETNPAALVYSNSGTTVPATIRNGKIDVRLNENRKYEEELALFFNHGGQFAANPGYFDVQTLKTPFVIQEEHSIEIAITTPPSLTLTNNHFVEVMLMGMRTTRKKV
ncbi:MAG: hypothetical protein AAFQ92_21470 [Bacteroidota bacterium]